MATRAQMLGKRVAELRVQRFGWSQQNLADRLGVAMMTISRLERGVGPHSVRLIVRLAQLLETTVDWLTRPPDAAPPSQPNKTTVMSSPEFERAPPLVKELFEHLRRSDGVDLSVIGWGGVLANLSDLHAQGLLGPAALGQCATNEVEPEPEVSGGKGHKRPSSPPTRRKR